MSTELPENLLWDPDDPRLGEPALPEGGIRLTQTFRLAELETAKPPVIGFYGASPVHPLHALVSFADEELPADRSEMRRLLSVRLQAMGDELMQQWEARQENRDAAER